MKGLHKMIVNKIRIPLMKKPRVLKQTSKKDSQYKLIKSKSKNYELAFLPSFEDLSRSINWHFRKDINGPDGNPLYYIIRAEWKQEERPILEHLTSTNLDDSRYASKMDVHLFPTNNDGIKKMYEWLENHSHQYEAIYKSTSYYLPSKTKSGKRNNIQCMDRFYVDLDIEKMRDKFLTEYSETDKAYIKVLNPLYNPEQYSKWIKADTDQKKVDLIIQECESVGLPAPTEIQFSGRGVHIFWLLSNLLFVSRYKKSEHHQHTPKTMVDFVETMNKEIAHLLTQWNADPAPALATSVLRLAGTFNRKESKILCRTLYTNMENIYSSDDMKACVLPSDIRTIEDKREDAESAYHNYYIRKAEFKSKQTKTTRIKSKAKKTKKHKFTYAKYHNDIIHDLKTLASIRQGVSKGLRSDFSSIACMAVAGVIKESPHKLLRVTKKHIQDFMPSSYMESKFFKDNNELVHKLEQYHPSLSHKHANSWKYRYSTQTMISKLKITEKEMSSLKTLVSPEIKRYRKVERQKEKRREQGIKSRDEYIQNSIKNIKPWLHENMSEHKWRRLSIPEKEESMKKILNRINQNKPKNKTLSVCANKCVGKLYKENSIQESHYNHSNPFDKIEAITIDAVISPPVPLTEPLQDQKTSHYRKITKEILERYKNPDDI